MTLTERVEHEIKHLVMVSPETARALLAENARLSEAIENAPHTEECDLMHYAPSYIVAHDLGCTCSKAALKEKHG